MTDKALMEAVDARIRAVLDLVPDLLFIPVEEQLNALYRLVYERLAEEAEDGGDDESLYESADPAIYTNDYWHDDYSAESGA